jgi:plastocyanin
MKGLAVAGVALLLAAVAVAVSSQLVAGATRNVSVGDNFYQDAVSNNSTTTISAGDTVVWTFSGSLPHTVTSDDGTTFASGSSQTSGTFSFTFITPGTYEYYCAVHSAPTANVMNGTVIVQEAATATNTSAAATPTRTRTPEPGETPDASPTPSAVATVATTPGAAATPTAITAAPIAATVPSGGAGGGGIGAPAAGHGPADGTSAMTWLAIALAVAGVTAMAGAAVMRRLKT